MIPKRNFCQKHVFVTKRTQVGPKSISLKPTGYKHRKDLEFRIKQIDFFFQKHIFHKKTGKTFSEHYLAHPFHYLRKALRWRPRKLDMEKSAD